MAAGIGTPTHAHLPLHSLTHSLTTHSPLTHHSLTTHSPLTHHSLSLTYLSHPLTLSPTHSLPVLLLFLSTHRQYAHMHSTYPQLTGLLTHSLTHSLTGYVCSSATLEVYKEQNLFQRADELAPYFQEAVHSLHSLPYVIDIRNCGLMGAVEFTPHPGEQNNISDLDVFLYFLKFPCRFLRFFLLFDE